MRHAEVHHLIRTDSEDELSVVSIAVIEAQRGHHMDLIYRSVKNNLSPGHKPLLLSSGLETVHTN